MSNKAFFNSEHVEAAKEFAENYNCGRDGIESMLTLVGKMIKDKLDDKTISTINDIFNYINNSKQNDIEFSFLRGLKYAIDKKITKSEPSKPLFKHSDYRKNFDFGFVLYFGDNDFSMHFDKAGELYCKEFNRTLCCVDQAHESMLEHHIKDVENLMQKETIINMIKNSFAAQHFEFSTDRICIQNINFEDNIKKLNWYVNDYFNFNDNIKRKNEEISKLIIGKIEDINNVIPKLGNTYDDDDRMFPIDGNGEILIVYFDKEDFKLKYVIR